MTNFVFVYGLCNYYASRQETHYELFFDWELSIPHWPWMMVFYRSLDLLLFIVLWALSADNMRKYAKAMMVSLYMAVPIFILVPAKLGFERLATFEQFELAYRVLYAIDLPHNLLPSMHVTYASLGIWAILKQHRRGLAFNLFMWSWLILICASIVLVHQHHVLDIPAGLLLAYINFRVFFKDRVST